MEQLKNNAAIVSAADLRIWRMDLIGSLPVLRLILRSAGIMRAVYGFIMKTTLICTGKVALLLTAVCAVMLASSNTAKAVGNPLPPVEAINLTISQQHELGQVLPDTTSGNVDRERYVNFMIGLSLGGSGHVIINGPDNLVSRSNDFGPLSSEGTTINLGTKGTYDYGSEVRRQSSWHG